jgi:nickel transport protein
MKSFTIAACVLLATILCLAPDSHAHRVNIFAYVDGDTVVTESGYSRSSRVNNGTVEVMDGATGALLLTGTTDADGRFAFAVPGQARGGGMDLLLRVTAGEGHQAEWTVTAQELAAATAAAGAATTVPEQQAPTTPSEATPAEQPDSAPAIAAPTGDTPLTSAQAEAMLRRELAPVKQMLAELSQPGPGMTEIVGGIGYILGIFGVFAYMKSRARTTDDRS